MHNIKKTFDIFYKIILALLKDQVDDNGNFKKPGTNPGNR